MTNRITPQAMPDGCTSTCNDYIYCDGTYYSLISPRYNVRLDEPCTGKFDCECFKCANCLPEIDLDRLCYGSDSVEPIKPKECDDDNCGR